jgi:diguanylate cyclase (GGDEF)-like protein
MNDEEVDTRQLAAANTHDGNLGYSDAVLALIVSNPVESLLRRKQLQPRYQLIASLADGGVIGYEGLIRGPAGSAVESPLKLFEFAQRAGLVPRVDAKCSAAVVHAFVGLELPGKLFVNLCPESLMHADIAHFASAVTDAFSFPPDRIVIEVTESQEFSDWSSAKRQLTLLRALGFQLAIDDLGEGYASLKLWSELRPEFVKIDKHFVDGIHADSFKQHFVRAIKQISEVSGTKVIAEGIEVAEDLLALRDLGIDYGQGYLLGRPSERPAAGLDAENREVLSCNNIAVLQSVAMLAPRAVRAGKLSTPVAAVTPLTTNAEVMDRFNDDPSLSALPVVVDGVPVGIIRRPLFVQEFSRPFRHELYDKKSCTVLMERDPLVVDSLTSIADLSAKLTEVDRRHLASGFIITASGRYIGMGSGQALLRELNEMQLQSARYANPLTLLPGNVPIEEHIDRLISAGTEFVAAYADIDAFKPFNDVYGYRRGDDLIQGLANALKMIVAPGIDFVGHIGGDDFVLCVQSPDWENRFRKGLSFFADLREHLVDPEHLAQGFIISEDRAGKVVKHYLPSLSIGALRVSPNQYSSHLEVSAALADAKREAKKTPGDTLFVERRRASGGTQSRQ